MRFIRLFPAVAILCACFVVSVATGETVVEHPEWKQFFEKENVTGTTLIYDLKGDTFHVFDNERASRPFTPASTFKIPNSLIALETGVVRDENHLFPWDGTPRRFKEWSRDHTLRTAIQFSVVPIYQQIAREIGPERMQHYVTAFGYGNQDISGGIDRFWLGSSLQISAFEEIGFLKKLYLLQLPVSERSVRIVKDILVTEASRDYILRAKSGYNQAEGSSMGLGWWVGWVETGDNTWFFATNMDVSEPSPKRMTVTREALRSLKALP